MTSALTKLCEDLGAEHRALDDRLPTSDEDGWACPTPAAGWSVSDTVNHLAYFDRVAALAMRDPAAFEQERVTIEEAFADGVRLDLELSRSKPGAEVLDSWRRERAAFLSAARQIGPGTRVPWFGPAMSPASFITARLMETWAHGQDIVDALGAPPVITDRLRHVCHIGVAARPFAFAAHDRADPGGPIHVELVGPAGRTWSWGPDDASDRISGAALDFALLVTQRRHPADLELTITGPSAKAWVEVAQAFAGPGTWGRQPGLGRVEL